MSAARIPPTRALAVSGGILPMSCWPAAIPTTVVERSGGMIDHATFL